MSRLELKKEGKQDESRRKIDAVVATSKIIAKIV